MLMVLPEFYSKGTLHLYGPLAPCIVGVTLQHQVALLFADHSPTLWKTHLKKFHFGMWARDWYAISFSGAVNHGLIIILRVCIQ